VSLRYSPYADDTVEKLGGSTIGIPTLAFFDGLSKASILRHVRRPGSDYAAITPIGILAGLNLASRRKFCAVDAS
jgi:hypothetical protein